MILRFSVENWMSFRDCASLTMIATRERQHGERVPRIDKFKMKLLPIAAMYGGNASGKTNFFKALNFMRKLVVKGTQPDNLIQVEPYRLDPEKEKAPLRFEIEILVDETVYEFSFAVTQKAVIEEKLVKISSLSEKVLYERRNGEMYFHNKKDKFLEFAFRGTRDNQLFLTNSISQKVDTFRPVYNWFKNDLELIAPNAQFVNFGLFLDKAYPLHSTMSKVMPLLDTGITYLAGESVQFENVPLLNELKEDIQEQVMEETPLQIIEDPLGSRYIISRENGELKAQKMVACHKKTDGSEVKFDIQNESDGSQRIIDLLPAFLMMAESGSHKVVVIDEIDRSLHTLMTRCLLEAFLSQCSTESRSQLLFTTHDALLMDQDLFRRDEVWIAERDSRGASTLLSFSEFKDIRYDKDIRKSYLQGRMGGVPRLSLRSMFPKACGDQNTGSDD